MRYLVELNNFESPSEKHAREVAEAAARGEAHPAKKLRTPEPEDLKLGAFLSYLLGWI
jgi:hypothetical protein